jgi:hypothetical protein
MITQSRGPLTAGACSTISILIVISFLSILQEMVSGKFGCVMTKSLSEGVHLNFVSLATAVAVLSDPHRAGERLMTFAVIFVIEVFVFIRIIVIVVELVVFTKFLLITIYGVVVATTRVILAVAIGIFDHHT